jgi:hypothetical protein
MDNNTSWQFETAMLLAFEAAIQMQGCICTAGLFDARCAAPGVIHCSAPLHYINVTHGCALVHANAAVRALTCGARLRVCGRISVAHRPFSQAAAQAADEHTDGSERSYTATNTGSACKCGPTSATGGRPWQRRESAQINRCFELPHKAASYLVLNARRKTLHLPHRQPDRPC